MGLASRWLAIMRTLSSAIPALPKVVAVLELDDRSHDRLAAADVINFSTPPLQPHSILLLRFKAAATYRPISLFWLGLWLSPRLSSEGKGAS